MARYGPAARECASSDFSVELFGAAAFRVSDCTALPAFPRPAHVKNVLAHVSAHGSDIARPGLELAPHALESLRRSVAKLGR
jgi:hypothetical protein